MSNEIKEKCGVFGIRNVPESARHTFFGLYTLQHRGQESAGIVSLNGEELIFYEGMGLVSQVFNDDSIIKKLVGDSAVGHVRYSTDGPSVIDNSQPYSRKGLMALSYNGNCPNPQRLREYGDLRNINSGRENDTGLMGNSLEFNLERGASELDAVREIFPYIEGAASVVFLTKKGRMVAFRDYHGVKPLSMGRIGDGVAFASETCAFDIIGAKFIRDIKPGEVVIVDDNGIYSEQLAKPEPRMDAMEFLYVARPDSIIDGRLIDLVRGRLGEELAREAPADVDLVMGIPDSGIPSGEGFAREMGLPYRSGLIKNRYVARTFINPTQEMRERGVRIKMNPMPYLLEGKRVAITDDTIIRGTTNPIVAEIVRKAGAREIHMRITSPPYIDEHDLGIDTPYRTELIANKMSVEDMIRQWNLDSLHYLSLSRMVNAIGIPAENLYLRPFNSERITYRVEPVKQPVYALS